jgi:hypothetical protein
VVYPLFRNGFSICLILAFWNCFVSDHSTNQLPLVEVRAVRVPNGGFQPQVIRDGAGVIHVLYYRGAPANGNLYYVKSSDEGVDWSDPIRVNSTEGSAVALGTIRGGQLAIGRSGRAYAVWNGSSRTEAEGPLNPESGKKGSPLLYARLNDSRTAFEREQNLMTGTFGLDGGAAIAADRSGTVYVAWHAKGPGATAGEAGRQIWVTKSTDDGKTFAAERPASNDPTGVCGCCGIAMYASSSGSVYALYRSATQSVHRNIYLLASSDRGRTFSDRKLHAWDINACPMSSMGFAEGIGRVEAAWETDSQVYFEPVTEAKTDPVSAPGPNKGHKHPRLSIGPNGATLLVWTEGTGWGRGGTVAWQVYDSRGTVVGAKGTANEVPAWSFAAPVASKSGFLVFY